MTEYEIRVSSEAEADLRDIISYISNELKNPEAASRFASDVDGCMDSLKFMPFRHQIGVKVSSGDEIRFVRVGSYTVAYTVDQCSASVYVLSVVYSRRNITDPGFWEN